MLKRLYEWIKKTVMNDFAFNKPFNAEPKWEDTSTETLGQIGLDIENLPQPS